MPSTRTTDPETSHEAAMKVKNITIVYGAIIELLTELPRTDTMLRQAYDARREARGWPLVGESSLRSRRSELVTRGTVVDTGLREILDSGRRSIIWGA